MTQHRSFIWVWTQNGHTVSVDADQVLDSLNEDLDSRHHPSWVLQIHAFQFYHACQEAYTIDVSSVRPQTGLGGSPK
jgi:hypothetical protein